MVVPAYLVENRHQDIENAQDEVQAVLIDFGQAVDVMHPDAVILLQRDLERIRSFFARQGVKALCAEAALAFVVDDEERALNLNDEAD